MKYVMIQWCLAWYCWFGSVGFADVSLASLHERESTGQSWARLLEGAERLHLPTKFLRALPSGFVHFEFDDLRTYAAEYHPGEHRMLLNRTMSLNAAGRVLKPLGRMTHKELEVLYHELFHAYMDYLMVRDIQFGVSEHHLESLVRFAKEQRMCRYGEVMITPIVQRMDEVEARYLTEAESWEALNETWAVFVGWVVWNRVELQQQKGKSIVLGRRDAAQWVERFKGAFEKGEFRGYYVPEEPDERRLAQKRYLAKSSQLSLEEAITLMEQVFGFPDDFVQVFDAAFGPIWRSSCSAGEGREN